MSLEFFRESSSFKKEISDICLQTNFQNVVENKFEVKKNIDNKFTINQRRYLGNKYNILGLINSVIKAKIPYFTSFCDIFGGTGVVGDFYNSKDRKIISNDLLYCNYLAINSFLGVSCISIDKIEELIYSFNQTNSSKENYVSKHFGNRFFTQSIAIKIGEIRDSIEHLYINKKINFDEKSVLLTSLLYAMDKIANTVGHYDAYIKKEIENKKFLLKTPKINMENNLNNEIYNLDANNLIKQIKCDILYIDPPYNSRQYSDAYHLLENIMRWEKPEVFGEAKKFDRTKLKSEYNLKTATKAFSELIENSNCKHILFSYNNMRDKGNNRSNARIKDEDILYILNKKGKVEIFEQDYKEFNTGKKIRGDNKERIFYVKAYK